MKGEGRLRVAMNSCDQDLRSESRLVGSRPSGKPTAHLMRWAVENKIPDKSPLRPVWQFSDDL
jgi:hypothetical protein